MKKIEISEDEMIEFFCESHVASLEAIMDAIRESELKSAGQVVALLDMLIREFKDKDRALTEPVRRCFFW